jgi:uncharacterized membrane protein YbaN (DUF454 family)
MNGPVPPSRSHSGRTRRALLFAAGSIALALGVLGVLLPVLPTTPFLIVAAYCFAHSSERAHRWLLGNRVFGPPLRDYISGRGVPRRVKGGVLALLWVVIGVSSVLVIPWTWARVLLAVIGIGVTVHILMLKNKVGGSEPQADQRMPES